MANATTEPILSGRAGRLLVLISLGTVGTMGGRLLFAPLLPAIVSDLSLSTTQAGVALSVLWACSALIQYPSGRASDELSRKTILVGGLVLMAVGSVVVSRVGTYPELLIATACFGIGAGFYMPTSFAHIADLYDRRRGTAFGINVASVNLGGLLVAALAGVVLAAATWQTAFLVLFLFLFVLSVAMHFSSDQPYVFDGGVDFQVLRTIKRLLSDFTLRRTLLAMSLVTFCWQSVAGFVPTYLSVAKGTTTGFANVAFAWLFLSSLLINPVAGKFGDRFGHRPVATSGALISAIGIVVLLLTGKRLPLLAGIGLLGTGLASFMPSANTLLMSLFPDGSKGGDFGAVRSAYMAFGSLGPAYVGVVAGGPGYAAAFAGLVGILILGAVVLISLGR
jgi:MFS family permease